MARNFVGDAAEKMALADRSAQFALHIGTCVQIRHEYIKQVESDGCLNFFTFIPAIFVSVFLNVFSIVVILALIYCLLYSALINNKSNKKKLKLPLIRLRL